MHADSDGKQKPGRLGAGGWNDTCFCHFLFKHLWEDLRGQLRVLHIEQAQVRLHGYRPEGWQDVGRFVTPHNDAHGNPPALSVATISAFTCTVRSSYGYSSIRPFNWTIVLVPAYMNLGRNYLLTESTGDSSTVGGDMPPFNLLRWIYFQLTYYVTNQTSNKQVAGSKQVPCQTVETWTT